MGNEIVARRFRHVSIRKEGQCPSGAAQRSCRLARIRLRDLRWARELGVPVVVLRAVERRPLDLAVPI